MQCKGRPNLTALYYSQFSLLSFPDLLMPNNPYRINCLQLSGMPTEFREVLIALVLCIGTVGELLSVYEKVVTGGVNDLIVVERMSAGYAARISVWRTRRSRVNPCSVDRVGTRRCGCGLA